MNRENMYLAGFIVSVFHLEHREADASAHTAPGEVMGHFLREKRTTEGKSRGRVDLQFVRSLSFIFVFLTSLISF